VAVLAAILAVLGATLAFVAPAATAKENVKVTICHATGSHSNPYVTITVADNAIVNPNGHGTHTGPVYDPDANPPMDHWGDIIPAFPGFAGLNVGASVAGCETTVETDYDAEQSYCAVTAATANGYVLAVLSVTGAKSQDAANAALVDLAEGVTAGVIPPFLTFGGLNWDADGQALFARGCLPLTTPDSFTGSASKGMEMGICYNDANLTLSVVGTGSATSTVSQADADGKAQGAAVTNADAKMAAELAKYGGFTPGACPPAEVVPPTVVSAAEAATPEGTLVPVTVAEPATVAPLPAAVPAGGGSTAPDQTLPMWALVLVALGGIGVVASGIRLATTRSR